jgi:hypothetical protein
MGGRLIKAIGWRCIFERRRTPKRIHENDLLDPAVNGGMLLEGQRTELRHKQLLKESKADGKIKLQRCQTDQEMTGETS